MRHSIFLLMTPLLAAACVQPSTSTSALPDDTTEAETTEVDSDSSSDAPDVDPAELCEETDLEVIVPWSGPGVTTPGDLGPLVKEQYLLHSTWAIPAPGKEQEFLSMAVAVVGAAQQIPGLVAVSASRSERCGSLRTIGIWESPTAMFELLAAPEHVDAVSRTTEVSTTGKTTSWMASVEEAQALDFEAGRAKLAEVPTSPAYD